MAISSGKALAGEREEELCFTFCSPLAVGIVREVL